MATTIWAVDDRRVDEVSPSRRHSHAAGTRSLGVSPPGSASRPRPKTVAKRSSRSFEHALRDDRKVSIQALALLLDRVLGKSIQGQVTLTGSMTPAEAAQLQETVRALTPAERLALAKQRLGLAPADEHRVTEAGES